MAQCCIGRAALNNFCLARSSAGATFTSRFCGALSKTQPLKLQPFGASAAPPQRLRLSVRSEAGGGSGEQQTTTPYGLGGPGSFFGFGTFQEKFVGRTAMVGVVAALVMEVVTGKGIIGQLGLDPVRVRYPFLLGFLFLLVAGLLGGYVVIKNPPDESKAPPNAGSGVPRDPLKTFDPTNMETMTTYTRGGVVERPSGQGREPYVSDLED